MYLSNIQEVDVYDGIWGLKLLMTNVRCWWLIRPYHQYQRQNLSALKYHQWPEVVACFKSSLSRCQQHLFDPFLSLLILFLYLRRLLHKKSGRWIWCCPLLQAFIKKDWEGESCSISFYIHCLLHLLLGLLYGLVKWTSNMDWQPKNNILRTRGWIWERIASWISWSNIRRTQQNL